MSCGLCLQETFLQKHWAGIQQADAAITVWDSGVDMGILRYVGERSVAFPHDFVRLLLSNTLSSTIE
jgi:hypothetical protein